MEDIFYFSKNKIHLEDVYNICLEHDWYHDPNSAIETDIRIYSQPNDEFGEYFMWYDITNDDNITYSETDIAILADYKPATRIMISLRVRNLTFVLQFLKTVMVKFGGWAGCDDMWEKQYTVDNIHEMNCFKGS